MESVVFEILGFVVTMFEDLSFLVEWITSVVQNISQCIVIYFAVNKRRRFEIYGCGTRKFPFSSMNADFSHGSVTVTVYICISNMTQEQYPGAP